MEPFAEEDEGQGDLALLTSLLPPPLSLDILCAITGRQPVTILQQAEELVAAGHLCRYKEKGFGYYRLADFRNVTARLAEVPAERLRGVAAQAIDGVCRCLPPGPRRWLHLAHLYLVSELPLAHLGEVVQAGHHCQAQNLLLDASSYYRIAVENCDPTSLDAEEQESYIEAAIGLCTCRENSLPPETQRLYLQQALEFCLIADKPEQEIRLRVLLARTFLKTVRSDEADKHLDRARHMLEGYQVSREIGMQVALAQSELLFWQGYVSKAVERYESEIGTFEELPGDAETLKGCIRLGWIYGVAGETARGVGLIRRVRRRARELGARELERYATLVLVIVLADAGRIDEGAAFLDEVFASASELLDDYILWPGYGKRAYFAFCRGDYEQAFHYHRLTWEKAKAIGVPHHRGPDNIEVMLGLEERGYFDPEWHFEAEIERLLGWPDIFMKGVALRFRALKAYRRGDPMEGIVADLKRSIALLTRAGGKIELAHSQLLLARLRLAGKRREEAEKLLNAAWEVFSRVNPELFPEDLKPYLDQTARHALWVEALIAVGDGLGSIREREELLGQIIKHAMRIAGAERGAIFLRHDGRLEMAACRNLEAAEIASPHFAAQQRLLDEVFESGREAVRNGESGEAQDGSGDGVRGWSACFPVRLRARVMGAIFMDCELARQHLPADEVALLRIISNQAAVVLENMIAYEEVSDRNSSLLAEAAFYRESHENGQTAARMIGRSAPFREVLRLIDDVAASDTTVLITGETGVGKDLVAQAVHRGSGRADGPFIAINVASLSPELIASELFGHEKGAFTGANATRKGRFELASGGTLFLDDIDALSLDIQAKFLRVLETREFERVGGSRTLKTDFRLLAASNRDIRELVALGRFRSDLYYRLNVFPIHIRPLRERVDDIALLAQYYLDLFSKKFAKPFEALSVRELTPLLEYSWPGNIRELRHVIERAVLLSKGSRLTIPLLDVAPAPGGGGDEPLPTLREMEARHILRALQHCRGKVSGQGGAAALLGIKPTTLYSMMKRLGIEKDGYRLASRSGRQGEDA